MVVQRRRPRLVQTTLVQTIVGRDVRDPISVVNPAPVWGEGGRVLFSTYEQHAAPSVVFEHMPRALAAFSVTNIWAHGGVLHSRQRYLFEHKDGLLALDDPVVTTEREREKETEKGGNFVSNTLLEKCNLPAPKQSISNRCTAGGGQRFPWMIVIVKMHTLIASLTRR
jgi:hypothetical protein